jgi:hypothetical protein
MESIARFVVGAFVGAIIIAPGILGLELLSDLL